MPPSTPLPKSPLLPTAPRPRYNRMAIYIAVAIVAVTLPFTLKFQSQRIASTANKQWRMLALQDTTAAEAIKRFGPPTQLRDYSLAEGSFAGPTLGLKHFYRENSPDYAERLKAPVVWKFPEYSMIREMIWKLPDSSLTVWLHVPRGEITLTGDDTQIYLPPTADGEWVVLDNYRVGNDLLKPESISKQTSGNQPSF